MNRTQLSLLSLVAVGATTLVASSAQATESARRTGLGGTAMIEDSDDIYAFPQAAFGKKLYLEANYRPSAGLYGGAGSGSIFFGNDQEVFGIMTHRGDYNAVLFNTLAGPFDNGNPFTSPNQAIDDFRVGLLKPPTPRANSGEKPATEVDATYTAPDGTTKPILVGTVVNAGEGTELADLALAPVQLIDVLYARNNFGVRLSAGFGSTSQDTQISWGDGYQVASSAVVTNIVAGFRGQQGADRFDASVELGYARAHTETLDVAEGLIGNDVTSSTPSIGAAIRYTMPKSETLDFVATGNLHYGTESTSTMTNDVRYYYDGNPDVVNTSLTPEEELREEDKFGPVPKLKQETGESTFALYAAAGPRYKIANRAIVTADVGVGLVRKNFDPFADSACTNDKDDRDICDGIDAVDLNTDNTIRYAWMLPSVRVAGEFNVTERVTVRTGMRSIFTLSTETIEANQASSPADVSEADEDNFVGDDKTQLTTGQTYYWSAGLGLNYGEFQFDAAFDTAFITNGPNFLSGESAPMFGLVTMKYDFGAGSSNNNVTGTRAGYPAEELAAPAAAPSFAAPMNNGFNP
ncbi:MAG: hypothetical protein HQ461_03280 [Deltaproteobacteria bacterium]|nr:hypothetical protein [Deltaproteobacteria bacterium]